MIVREIEVRYGKSIAKVDGRKVTNAAVAAKVLEDFIGDRPQEVFAAVLLDGRHRVTGVVEISVGTLTASLVHPREVFRAAILKNSAAIIIGHNHPSGNTKPSPEDDKVTERLREAGTLLGIKVLDHVVIGHNGDYFSYADCGR